MIITLSWPAAQSNTISLLRFEPALLRYGLTVERVRTFIRQCYACYIDENLKYMATMSILITILIQSYNVSCNNNKTVINLLNKILIGHVTWKMCTV